MSEYGTCPVCNGTLKSPAWWNEKEMQDCRNCGGQYMFGSPKGLVRLDKEGNPCNHSYVGRSTGRCLTTYDCKNCGDSYNIDSGD